ncbi:MAG: hypothetical protein CME64_11470 [Halobacteriovoraceae bacterium]|nr:hypothetical protein [Halobacteriovoraceae bacterium]|tara:strand:- start:43043 stop:43591 length:549 start_codon:yes stop_codon:yes gene_type:complete
MIDQKREEVINFWFRELTPEDWFKKKLTLDKEIRSRFLSVLQLGKRLELYAWRHSPQGRLAEIIVLDQFPRNIYRNDARAFESDNLALCLSQEAIYQKVDEELDPQQKSFLYMPFMHSESLVMQELSLRLFNQDGLEENYEFALRHHEIIKRFGRFPHRNELLNRSSTKDELEFLKSPGSSF